MQFYHAKIYDSFCYPSLDRVSFDWHKLSTHMLEAGPEGFDFDFSNYDRTLSHQLLYFSVQALLVGMKLTQIEEATLIETLCSPFMVFGNAVFRSTGGLMSGMLITYIINCTANEIMHRAAWTHIMSKQLPALVELRHYKTYTRGMRGGDDTITTVSPHVIQYYNGTTVAEYLNSRGMVVTDSEKNPTIVPFKDYLQLSFLKNKTGKDRGMFIPLCDLTSLYESTYWIRLSKQNNDALKATQDNIICSLRGIFFHGKKVYNEYRTAALDKCPQLTLPQYHELSVIWANYYGFPGAHADYATRELQGDPFVTAIRAQRIAPQRRSIQTAGIEGR
jgi:hypothetical protein